MSYIPILSTTVHELGHAAAARLLGLKVALMKWNSVANYNWPTGPVKTIAVSQVSTLVNETSEVVDGVKRYRNDQLKQIMTLAGAGVAAELMVVSDEPADSDINALFMKRDALADRAIIEELLGHLPSENEIIAVTRVAFDLLYPFRDILKREATLVATEIANVPSQMFGFFLSELRLKIILDRIFDL